MTTTYGLTATGFLPKTLEIILGEIKQDLRESYGTSIDLDNGLLARLAGIMAERYADLWELTEAVNSSQNPDKASGVHLEDVCLITGTFKIFATSSKVTLTLTGLPAVVVSAASRAATESTKQEFLTSDPATLVAVTAWAALTDYVAGDRRTNDSKVYLCIEPGTSAASGGPTTKDPDVTDGTVHWRFLGDGTAAADVAAEAVNQGIVVAVSGDINDIKTPTGGWQGVINILDAVVGFDDQSDEALRVTREEDLAGPGTSTPDAIFDEVKRITGVISVTVFVNNTDATVDGMPPHSIEVLVRGGADQDIWNALGRNVAGGIQTVGTEVGTYTDKQGEAQAMRFNRPDEVDVWVSFDAEVDDDFPDDGTDQMKLAIITWGQKQDTGRNVVASRVGREAMIDDSVLDVTNVLIGTADPPVAGTTIQIGKREVAVYDTSRIDITIAEGEP